MISLARRWIHYRAANRGWNEIYEHLEKQIDETLIQSNPDDCNSPNVSCGGITDSVCAISTYVSQKDCLTPALVKDTSTEDDDSNYTIVSYRHLTIKIEGKITISTNLISLSIYEV